MSDLARYLGQAVLYALFFVPVVYFSSEPVYQHLAADKAEIKLAIRHAGAVIGECTALGANQGGQRPSHVEAPKLCPRERSPLRLELILDGEPLYSATIAPAGLHNDGVSSMYHRFSVPAGEHRLQLNMNDDVATDDFTWHLDQNINLAPAQVLAITFKDGFELK